MSTKYPVNIPKVILIASKGNIIGNCEGFDNKIGIASSEVEI